MINREWTLFLDRDGVINERIVGGYVTCWEEFKILPGVEEALKIFSALFGKIIIVSNQQGIGKGLMTEEQLDDIHTNFLERISLAGGRIDAMFYATNLADENSPMRKPGPGMALKAKDRFPGIQFEKSIMAGDSLSDMQFGKNLGMYTVFIGSCGNQKTKINSENPKAKSQQSKINSKKHHPEPEPERSGARRSQTRNPELIDFSFPNLFTFAKNLFLCLPH